MSEPLSREERGATIASLAETVWASRDRVLLRRYEATVLAVEAATIYLVIRDTGRAEVVFASHDETERDRVLRDLRASAGPHSGVRYFDDLIALDDLTFAAFYLDEAASG